MNDRVAQCIYAAIDDANLERDEGPLLKKSPETPIHGDASGLDSLGLINFVVAVEEQVEIAFEVSLVLSDDRALAQEPSPFDSVASLAAYVEMLLEEQGVA